MNILIDIGHPAHVHLYSKLYFKLINDGHNLFVTVRDIESAIVLLNKYNIPYINLGDKSDNILLKGLNQLKYDFLLLKLILLNNIKITIGSPFNIAHVSKISFSKSILMDDDDDDVQPLMSRLGHPFADTVLSPAAVRIHRKVKKALFYDGYHELAYLHPNYFTPDPSVLKNGGLDENEPFFILRFNVFKAHHDIGVKGLSLEQKIKLIDLLKPYGKIFITTEREIEPELKEYQYLMDPDKIHHFLYYAKMFIGDSQTMTSEAAVLGTPAIRCNSFVGRISYLEEQEHKYGLTYGFLPEHFDQMLLKIEKLLSMPDLDKEWQKRRQKMLSEKIDVTAFLVWFVENYPESARIMREEPEYQWKFK